METIATICTSGGILEQGAIAAGLTPIWGVEIDPIVAELYRLNYPNSKTVVSDACKVDWRLLPTPDVLHASPSCRHFSIANNKSEAQQDIDLAKAITRALAHFQPKVFTLENVPAYSQSESWIAIAHQLEQLGYSINAQVYNLALFGIPQQRKRFIAIATKESTPPILIVPNRTAYWYECIEDLLGELKPSKLTNTQTNKLHPKIERVIATGETALLKRNQIRKYTPAAISNNPYCWTVTAKLCTDQHGRDRKLFADLVTPTGTYSLNTHCLARIQTIPDSYKLSGKTALDGLVIGDAVPPLFAQQMFEQILQHFKKSTMVDQLHKVILRIYSTPLQESTMVDKPQEVIRSALQELEAVVLSEVEGLFSFEKVGKALMRIKSEELYKQLGYSNFVTYCRDRFELSKSRVYQLIEAAKVKSDLAHIIAPHGLILNERQCRELHKLKDSKLQEEVLKSILVSREPITAIAIKRTMKVLKFEKRQSESELVLPEKGSIIRIVTHHDPELPSYKGYWGIVIGVGEFSCDARVLNQKLRHLHPQHLLKIPALSDAEGQRVLELLDRLDEIYTSEHIDNTVRNIIEAIATGLPYLDDWQEYLLTAIEKRIHKLNVGLKVVKKEDKQEEK